MRRLISAALIAAFVVVSSVTSLPAAEPELPEPPKPAAEHKFLKRFVGEWDCTTQVLFDPANPSTSKGTMSGKMIGNYWAVVTVNSEIGEAISYHGQGTFGFDSLKTKKCIGTWTDSMSPFMWKYEGKVDGNKLIFLSQGPDPTDPKKRIKARDTWEFKSDDLILLTGEMENAEGKLVAIMKSTCRRKKSSAK